VPSIKVLAIDGGGIRGIIPATILSEIQKRLDLDLFRVFDLIAGTSTGGIIALGIGAKCKNHGPYSPSELVDLYVQSGPKIFQEEFSDTGEDSSSFQVFSRCPSSRTGAILPRHGVPDGTHSVVDIQL